MPVTIEERFWSKVAFADQWHEGTRCLVWTGFLNKGYGRIRVGDKHVPAHRWLYERWFGPIPDGMQLDHLCHNGTGCEPVTCMHRACVNPAHLEPVTAKINRRRGNNANASKTHCKWGHELTPDNVYLKPPNGHRYCRKCHVRNSVATKRRRRSERQSSAESPPSSGPPPT